MNRITHILSTLAFAMLGQPLFCQFAPPVTPPLPPPPPTITPACDGCCAGKPAFTGLSGQIAVTTMFASGDGGPLQDRDVVIWNISPPYPPANSDWATIHGDPYYSDPSWNSKSMGDVFGLTIDSAGNIYTTATTIYGAGNVGNLANPQTFDPKRERGQIYKIAGNNGQVTPWVQLPNPNGAGLGNITYDCGNFSFYVSNFDDGLIYRLSSAGKTLSTWDHGANLGLATDLNGAALSPLRAKIPPSTTACPSCGQDALGYAKLGRRPWAVHVYHNRLYYSIWNMDNSQGTTPNEIWSIALDPSGNFSGPERLELTMPMLSSSYLKNNPVSDLVFGPQGTMILAERTMQGDHVPANAFTAHYSRVMEFGWSGSSWFDATPSAYKVGCDGSYTGTPTNSAGGVDFDLTPGAKFQVWATADKLHRRFETANGCDTGSHDDIYGLQGFLPGHGDVTNSILIDMDKYTQTHNKMQIGDVKIPCPVAALTSLPIL